MGKRKANAVDKPAAKPVAATKPAKPAAAVAPVAPSAGTSASSAGAELGAAKHGAGGDIPTGGPVSPPLMCMVKMCLDPKTGLMIASTGKDCPPGFVDQAKRAIRQTGIAFDDSASDNADAKK